ncbi:MAG: N-formylglutamate amidohydrolase [Myxococcota bacterium]
MFRLDELGLVVTCEHGGNRVPAKFRGLFANSQRTLDSHRGWDPGALRVAKHLAKRFEAPLVACTMTRLLVDTNRPLGHPGLFSPYSRRIDEISRKPLLDYHRAHWRTVEGTIRRGLQKHRCVIHVAVHSFTPKLRGKVREADVALLYDPKRATERAFCDRWLQRLARSRPTWQCRRNYPYRGSAPGLTTSLRELFSDERYVGIEVEMNQRYFRPGGRGSQMQEVVIGTLANMLK